MTARDTTQIPGQVPGQIPGQIADPGWEADNLFRAVIDTAVDGIIVIDEAGRVQLFNRSAERLFGFAPHEVLGRTVDVLMPEPYRSRHDDYMRRYQKTGEARIIGLGREVLAQRKDGSTFPMYLSVGETRLDGARIFLGIIHDLTERTEKEREVQALQNDLLHALRLSAMGQLTSALAHELNQPLTAVMNYLNAARRGLEGTDGPVARARELVEKAVAQTSRAGQIIRRLRAFIEKKEPDRTLEDLNASVEEAIALALVGTAHRDIRVSRELASGLPKLLMDRIQIQQIVVNLVRNAVEAMEHSETKELVIRTLQPSAAFLEVSVADSGPGIAPETAANLFVPFATTKAKGLGMGLAICKAIVEAHGGRLWLAERTGGGAEFAFRLPLGDGSEE